MEELLIILDHSLLELVALVVEELAVVLKVVHLELVLLLVLQTRVVAEEALPKIQIHLTTLAVEAVQADIVPLFQEKTQEEVLVLNQL